MNRFRYNLGRMPELAGNIVISLFNRQVLHHVDYCISPSAGEPLKYPPIFVLGAPRCGSTLLIQVLTEAFDVGYLSNAHARFYGCPALAERYLRPIRNRPDSGFRSFHGITKGHSEPAECGDFWYRFFPRDPVYVTSEQVRPENMLAFRRSVAGFTAAMDRPVLFKNLNASFRLAPILQYLPEALLIWCRRSMLDNAHSIMEARRKRFGRYDRWWSLVPPNISDLCQLEVYKQPVEQIRSINRVIEWDLERLDFDPSRLITLTYEELCEGSESVINAFGAFLNRNGIDLARRGSVPSGFSRSKGIRIDPALYRKMEQYIAMDPPLESP